MMISIQIHEQLLKRADQRAQSLGISRDRFIVRAVERELHTNSDWSAGFFDRLQDVDQGTADAVEEMMSGIRTGRRSKLQGRV
jgi:hypothetical protein